jgi:methionyl aminopeptidase
MKKSFEEKIKIMKEGGKILKEIFEELRNYIKPGISTFKIDQKAGELFEKFNVKSAFKGYRPDFSNIPYPANVCLSLNEIIVHGIPSEKKILKEGDVLKIDMGINYKGLFLDAATTLIIGETIEINKKLVETTKESLIKAIEIAKPKNTLGDIGYTIQKHIEENGFKVIKNLCGHDIGEYLHGNLQVLNFGKPKSGRVLKKGMIFTIEPMASISCEYAEQINDFEFKTMDNSISAHFEVTIAILENYNLILADIL